MRNEFLRERLAAFLERLSPPQAIKGRPEAMRDEMQALFSALSHSAPSTGYEEWWPRFEGKLLDRMQTRAWPIVSEIRKAAAEVRSTRPLAKTPADDEWRIDPAEMAARRMQAGEAVGEVWIYGIGAVELAARALIDADTMRRYRSAAYFSRKDVYGEDSAKRWEAEREEAHEAAKAVWRSREDKRAGRSAPMPDKREVPKVAVGEW